jgi:ribosomal-protein-alanine N-acetyltransferase
VAHLADVPAMMDLERQNPSAAHWSRQQYEALFITAGGQSRAERVAWVIEDQVPKQLGRAASGAGTICAFLAARKLDAEWELENIVVAARTRRQGFGSLLVRELIAHATKQKGSSIFLEVRESNQGARSLYRKLGFEKAGLRKSYYVDPSENAILYRLSL